MNIEIKPEDVDALVRDALLKAGIGKTITEAVSKALSGYNNPVDEKLKLFVGEIAAELIREKWGSEIRASVARHIEALVTQEIVDKTANQAVEKMVKAAESRW